MLLCCLLLAHAACCLLSVLRQSCLYLRDLHGQDDVLLHKMLEEPRRCILVEWLRVAIVDLPHELYRACVTWMGAVSDAHYEHRELAGDPSRKLCEALAKCPAVCLADADSPGPRQDEGAGRLGYTHPFPKPAVNMGQPVTLKL